MEVEGKIGPDMTSSGAEKTAEEKLLRQDVYYPSTNRRKCSPPAWNLTDTNILNRLGIIEEQIDYVQYKSSLADNHVTALFEPLQSIISNTRRISHDMTRDHDRILDYTRAFAREYDDMARERARDRESERSTRKRTANQTSQTRETQTDAVKDPRPPDALAVLQKCSLLRTDDTLGTALEFNILLVLHYALHSDVVTFKFCLMPRLSVIRNFEFRSYYIVM